MKLNMGRIKMMTGKGWHFESLRHSKAKRFGKAGGNYHIGNPISYSSTGSEFKKLTKQVARGYEGKSVPKKFQKIYGKTYSKEEALEVGKKTAGKRFWKTYGKKIGKEIISKEVRKAK